MVERSKRPQAGVTRDAQFFWDGVREGRLLIQRCSDCKGLRHPPGPMCSQCGSLEWDSIEASGRGIIYSFVVTHHPPIPPFEYPHPIALVELEEGTRFVADLVGIAPEAVTIGMPVQVEFHEPEGETRLPCFRPTTGPKD